MSRSTIELTPESRWAADILVERKILLLASTRIDETAMKQFGFTFFPQSQ